MPPPIPGRAMGRCLAAAVAVGLVSLLACPPAPSERCNTDRDCANGSACVDGLCHSLALLGGDDDAGSSIDAGSSSDAGAADAGAADAGAGDAGTPDGGGCGEGAHDGGDGVCVPVGNCSPGFARLYLDNDGDGVGAGPQRDACDLPGAAGLAATGTDCDDDDPRIAVAIEGFVDEDDDGYTTGPLTACTAGALPSGMRLDERLAPVVLFDPTEIDGSTGNNSWANADRVADCCGGTSSVDIDTAEPTQVLTLSGFTCSAAPVRVDVIRVRVRGRLAVSGSQELPLEVRLARGGLPGTARSTPVTWPANDTSAVLEGTPTEWGIDLPPAEVCASDLELQVRLLPNGTYGGNVLVDTITVEVDGVDDCAPQDAAAFAAATLHADLDGDGHHGPTVAVSCIGATDLAAPEGLTARDCDDGDSDVKPGQSAFFGVPTQGGGYDYDCDGLEEHQLVLDATACTEDVDAGACAATTTLRDGACGDAIDADDCPQLAPCSILQDTDRILCR